MCAHRVVGGGACVCCLPPRVHRAPCVLIGWCGAGGLFGPCAERLRAHGWGGNLWAPVSPDSSFFLAALVLHSVGASALPCRVCKRGGCSCTVIAHAIAGGSSLALLLILVAVPGVGWVPLPGSEGGRVQPRSWGEGGTNGTSCASALCARRGDVVRVLMSGWQPLWSVACLCRACTGSICWEVGSCPVAILIPVNL